MAVGNSSYFEEISEIIKIKTQVELKLTPGDHLKPGRLEKEEPCNMARLLN